MRILLCSQSYPPRLGGLETVVRRLAIEFSQRGHQVHVVSNRYPRTLQAREVRDGIEVSRFQFLSPGIGLLMRRPDLWLASLFFGPATAKGLNRIMNSFQPDVVNVHFPDRMIPFVQRLRRRWRFRLVVSLHGNDVERFALDGRGSEALCSFLRETEAVTACSGYLLKVASGLEPSLAAKGTAIYNGVRLSRFLDETVHPHERPYFLAVGRLTFKKGIDLLVEAFARISSRYPGIDLLVAGEGEQRESLLASSIRLGIASRVFFLGGKSVEEVTRLYNGCLVTVVPSREEAFGLVALEALAAGKPIVASRVGGMAEFLQGILKQVNAAAGTPIPTGRPPVMLVDPNVESLADALDTCLRIDCSEIEQKAVTAAVLQHFEWANVVRQYEAVLRG